LAPLDDFCPPQTFILGHIWDKKRSGEDFIWLILGQKHSVSGEDLFFFFFQRSLNFGPKTHPKSGDDLFFFSLENAGFWDKKQFSFSEEPYFALKALDFVPPVLK